MWDLCLRVERYEIYIQRIYDRINRNKGDNLQQLLEAFTTYHIAQHQQSYKWYSSAFYPPMLP